MHDLPSSFTGADIGDGIQPYQLRQAARSGLAEAIGCGSRLVAALRERPAKDIAAALAAAPAAPAPAKKGCKAAAPAAAAAAPASCPVWCDVD